MHFEKKHLLLIYINLKSSSCLLHRQKAMISSCAFMAWKYNSSIPHHYQRDYLEYIWTLIFSLNHTRPFTQEPSIDTDAVHISHVKAGQTSCPVLYKVFPNALNSFLFCPACNFNSAICNKLAQSHKATLNASVTSYKRRWMFSCHKAVNDSLLEHYT